MKNCKGIINLALLVVVLPLAVWCFAIGRTVRMSRQTAKINSEIAELQQQVSSEHTAATSGERRNQNEPAGGSMERVMQTIAGSGCAVVRYSPFVTERRDGITVCTAELVVSGSFTNIVRFIQRAERATRLISVELKTIKPRDAAPQLHGAIIMQEVEE